ncbi:MAG: sulfur carrier protein ThiS [Anaerovoracaceae bacterium]
MVKINGKQYDIAGSTLREYLENASYDSKRVAIERNGRIIPKAQYGETILEDGDEIEIVSFVGGG